MSSRVPQWLPSWLARPDDPQRCREGIDGWARTLARSGLTEHFGETVSTTVHGSVLLDELERIARKHWDFRGGRERNLASAPQLTGDLLAVLAAVVGPLGLDGTPPPQRDSYDAVLMTGGMVRAGIVKPRYLRELVDAGLKIDEGTFLGAFRQFTGDEASVATQLGVVGDDEFDAMRFGMVQAFGSLQEATVREYSSDTQAASWRDERWELPGTRLRVVAAPSSDPTARRANTADTFRFWARDRGQASANVLVVTTPIYVPYQAAVAVDVLGVEFGWEVETVAVSGSASDLGTLSQEFLPHHQLQELTSAITGLRNLRASVAEAARS